MDSRIIFAVQFFLGRTTVLTVLVNAHWEDAVERAMDSKLYQSANATGLVEWDRIAMREATRKEAGIYPATATRKGRP